MNSMNVTRMTTLPVMALATMLAAGHTTRAAELIYGNWTPALEYQNRVAMPEVFKNIEAETKGDIKWKLIPGGQIADGKTTFTAVKDGLMQGGLAIVPYVPNSIPSVYAIYSTLIFGEDDVVAASGAAVETIHLHCPSCIEEYKKFNAVGIGGWTSSAYYLACREPIKTYDELKGKRVRATGGNAEMLKLAGMVPIGATLTEAVGLLQRGGLDCQHGIHDWLRTFGYGDFAKYVMDAPLGLSGPAIGMYLNRDTWKAFTPEQKKIHVKWGAWLSAKLAIGNFIESNEASLKTLTETKGLQIVKVGTAFNKVTDDYNKAQRAINIETAKKFGVSDPEKIIDYYSAAVERWRAKSKVIGRDVNKFTDALNSEVFSKVDPEKL
jgi:TRAP-type C4-dicarboxylate transport system substrate-binding protein